MCKDPNTLPDGSVVACRNCELCRYNRVKDWAGRNIAQSKVSAASFACTLTYGPELDQYPMGHAGEYGQPIPGRTDHLRMAVLTYSDVQKFLKYLRTVLGYEVDYLVTGELGNLKRRTHWHIILHFRNRVPSHEVRVNFSDRHKNEFGEVYGHEVCKAWPHGFMYWIPAKFEDVFYNCKYLLKDEQDEAAQRKPGMSKKPPLGADYFVQWADLHVAQHLAPQTLEYRFPEVRKKDGTPMIFMLKGRTAEIFLDRYIARWTEVHGDKTRPRSDLVDLYERYGKIVTDEARMLLREEFPRGESRQQVPKGARIMAVAEEVKAERDGILREVFEMDKDRVRDLFVKEANNEQERERRQEVVFFDQHDDRERFEQEWAEFGAYKAKHGWEFVVGKGWLCNRPGPGKAGSESFTQWRYKRWLAAPESGGTIEGSELPAERLGPVGTYNKHFGPEGAGS